MPIPLIAAQAGANVASGLISGTVGLIQKGQGNKILKGLQYPTEALPDEYMQNENLAGQMAGQGLPSEQYNQSMRDIQRQQLMALRYSKDRRGGLAVLPSVLQSTSDSELNLEAKNAEQRIANQRYLIGVRNQTAGVKRDLFDKNVRSKYNRDYNYGMNLQGAGNQNLVGGLDKIASGGLMAFGGGSRTGSSGSGSGGGYSSSYSDPLGG